MTRLLRWSVMSYGSLRAEFVETKHNGHIHRYGTLIFDDIAVVYVSQPINNNNQILSGL